MTQQNDHVARKQLKAITSHGKRHSSTISGNVRGEGIFPQPLYTPKVKKAVKRSKAKGRHFVEHMTISIDLDVKDGNHNEGFLKLLKTVTGLIMVERNFELLSTTEKVIRALAKAKFKNVATLVMDSEEIYHHPEDHYDFETALQRLIKTVHERGEGEIGNMIYLELLSNDHRDCSVEVKISRVHTKWVHDILIKFNGILPEEYFRRVINYLEDHLEIEGIENRWRTV